MDQNILNLAVLLVGCILGLWQSILKSGSRRITKSTKEMYYFIQLAVLLSSLNALYGNHIQVHALASVGILVFILTNYFGGSIYSIRTESSEAVLALMEAAIREIEYVQPRKEAKKDSVFFHIPDTSRSVEYIEKKSVFTGNMTYSLRFRRWPNISTKKEILRYIEEGLQSEVLAKRKKIKVMGEALLVIALVCLALFMTTKAAMEPKYVNVYIENEVPLAFIIHDGDISIRDDEVLKEIHDIIVEGYKIRHDANGKDGIIRQPIYGTLIYGEDGLVVFITDLSSGGKEDYGAYLYIANSFLGSKSILYRFAWETNKLYNKNQGNYYYVFQVNERLTEVINHIN